MHLFYTPDITTNFYTLEETESKHATKVLRLKVSDEIYLTNGKGSLYKAKIIDDNPKRCVVETVEEQKNYNQRNYYLHLAVAPTKNIDRFEWFLEKATEIGIDEITPLLTENSERKVLKHDRAEKVIVSAIKQSLKAYCPILNPLTKFSDFLKKQKTEKLLLAHCYRSEKQNLKQLVKANEKVTILIGPEGDFTEAEVEKAMNEGAIAITLGNSRLRTETAAIAACHSVAFINI